MSHLLARVASVKVTVGWPIRSRTPVTGVMSVQVNDNGRTINPRAFTDVVVGTTCN